MFRSLLLASCWLTLNCPGSAGQLAPPELAQRAHASGACGSLGPGTGLRDGKGWIVSMVPGKHKLRMHGPGAVYLTVARLHSMDFDAGRPYYIVIENAAPDSELEWMVPGGTWATVSTAFLYPRQRQS